MNLDQARRLLEEFPVPPDCSCTRCVGMCKRSCWPSPAEAAKLLDMGLAKQLMKDQWYQSWGEGDIDLLCGAIPGHEGRNSPRRDFFDFGPDPRSKGCVLLKEGLCSIHACKPIEGRLAHHDHIRAAEFNDVHEAVAVLWDTDEGRAVVSRWERLVSDRSPEAQV